jgi:hypothetical protein
LGHRSVTAEDATWTENAEKIILRTVFRRTGRPSWDSRESERRMEGRELVFPLWIGWLRGIATT